MEEEVSYIKISRDNEKKENFFIEYSFNGITSRKRFWLSSDRDMKPFNKEVISNILRNTILEITSNRRFWELFSDILPLSETSDKSKKIKRKRNNQKI